MKSFRLDIESVGEAVESWPAFAAAAALAALLFYVGLSHATWRALLIVGGGIYLGYVLRGGLAKNLRAKYPNASGHALLGIGICVGVLGVGSRMAAPWMQNGPLDLLWIAVSFLSILAFVIINRRDPNVLR